MRTRWAVAVLALLVLAAACSSKGKDDKLAALDASTTTTESTTTTTAAPATSTTSTTAAPAPTTTTVKRTTTTTAKAAARSFTISPASGGNNTAVEAKGTGCTGPNAGVAIYEYNPSGQMTDGDGAAALPDGTWRVPMNFYAPPGTPAGRYKYAAKCTWDGGSFSYAPQSFTFTG